MYLKNETREAIDIYPIVFQNAEYGHISKAKSRPSIGLLE